jgi:hypothetical protein
LRLLTGCSNYVLLKCTLQSGTKPEAQINMRREGDTSVVASCATFKPLARERGSQMASHGRRTLAHRWRRPVRAQMDLSWSDQFFLVIFRRALLKHCVCQHFHLHYQVISNHFIQYHQINTLMVNGLLCQCCIKWCSQVSRFCHTFGWPVGCLGRSFNMTFVLYIYYTLTGQSIWDVQVYFHALRISSSYRFSVIKGSRCDPHPYCAPVFMLFLSSTIFC